MPTEHVVKQGEHLSQIAKQYGFFDYRRIWDHPQNAALKALRQNPNVLFPGDRLHVPDKELKKETRPTGQRHVFRIPGSSLMLRFRVKTLDKEPAANVACELEVDGATVQLTANADGEVERRIPATARGGKLIVRDLGIEAPVQIGHLDPVDTLTGQIARLNNLGYNAGPIGGGADDAQVRSAVEEFQCDNDLTVDGICGAATQRKLLEVHGC
jgi:N-acetylmuramoyl-L-alanine amidase